MQVAAAAGLPRALCAVQTKNKMPLLGLRSITTSNNEQMGMCVIGAQGRTISRMLASWFVGTMGSLRRDSDMKNDWFYDNCRQCLPSLKENMAEITERCLQMQTNTTKVKHGT